MVVNNRGVSTWMRLELNPTGWLPVERAEVLEPSERALCTEELMGQEQRGLGWLHFLSEVRRRVKSR